ncbi:hypothetical protein J3E68DRAFT_57324 [Trichoderma sp. SZMC 28012]
MPRRVGTRNLHRYLILRITPNPIASPNTRCLPSRNRHPCTSSNHVSLQRFQLDSCGAAVHLDPDMTFFARRYRFYCLLCLCVSSLFECLRPLLVAHVLPAMPSHRLSFSLAFWAASVEWASSSGVALRLIRGLPL